MDASVAAGFADTAGCIALGGWFASLELPSKRNNYDDNRCILAHGVIAVNVYVA
jgi:hypothetical protein